MALQAAPHRGSHGYSAIIESIELIPEWLVARIGLPTVFIEYDRALRIAGQSQWDYLTLFRLAFEGITSFSVAPLRLAMLLGG